MGTYDGVYLRDANWTGAFSLPETYVSVIEVNRGAPIVWTGSFDASRCSDVYGKSATVTPLSLTTQYYIAFA